MATEAMSLRYFNPIGADPRGRTGPYLAKPSAVLGKIFEAYQRKSKFQITGDCYATRDGTGIRDYVHIWDIALAHVAAVEHINSHPVGTHEIINLGSGKGLTVIELIKAFELAQGGHVEYEIIGARPGDVAGGYASREKAKAILGWSPERQAVDAIKDMTNWNAIKHDILEGH